MQDLTETKELENDDKRKSDVDCSFQCRKLFMPGQETKNKTYSSSLSHEMLLRSQTFNSSRQRRYSTIY